MPAKLNLIAISVIVGAAALSGCTSTSQVKPALTETATTAGDDAGFTVPLPETVSVLPEASGMAPVQTAEVMPATPALDAAAKPAAATAAFAGATPAAPAVPAVMTANAWQAPPPAKSGQPVAATYTTAGLVVPATAAGGQKTMPGVQQVAYVVPQNPAALGQFPAAPLSPATPEEHATGARGDVDRLIQKYAALYEVPVDLVRHVVNRESTYNPKAYNNGHWGLMQIKHATARGMGYDGPAKGLFDAETNLKYAVKYLRGAWLVADRNAKKADWLYQTGYYFDAKRKGLLEATGLGVDRKRRRAQPDA